MQVSTHQELRLTHHQALWPDEHGHDDAVNHVVHERLHHVGRVLPTQRSTKVQAVLVPA